MDSTESIISLGVSVHTPVLKTLKC